MTPAEQIAWHRSEADRIEAEERARRPALAQGQIWEWIGEGCTYITCATEAFGKVRLFNILDGNRLGGDGEFEGIPPERFRFVGLARDVLRVVPPDPPAPQVAPEPTGKMIDS